MTQATAPFERIKSRPAYELVAEAIERKILAGRLKPGDPVGTESELVKQFGVNRSTVREGIRLLEQSGLVSREPSRRLSVAVPHYHRLATRMTRALILQQVTFRELWHTSRALEPAAVDQAMDNATDEDLAALASNVDKTRKVATRSGRRGRARCRVPQADHARPRTTACCCWPRSPPACWCGPPPPSSSSTIPAASRA